MDHSKKSTYLFSIDALRVIAILAVIVIHVTTKTLATLHLDIATAPFSLFLNQTARFAVPLFFLISGFVLELNNKNRLSYITFFRKRASRIVIPYFFWTCVYLLFYYNFQFTELISPKLITALFLGNASYHLYFIPTLIIFYLAFPFFHSAIELLKKPPVLLLLWGLELFLLYQDYYIKQWDFSYDIRIAILSFAMFITGMAASHHKENIFKFIKRYIYVFAFSTILFPFIIFAHVQALSTKYHTSRFIYNQYGPLNYLYTLFLSSLLYFALEKTQFLRKFFINMSKLSFFVFFIHVLIQSLLWNSVIESIIEKVGSSFVKSIWFDPLLFLIITTASFGIAYFVHKIPLAYKITG